MIFTRALSNFSSITSNVGLGRKILIGIGLLIPISVYGGISGSETRTSKAMRWYLGTSSDYSKAKKMFWKKKEGHSTWQFIKVEGDRGYDPARSRAAWENRVHVHNTQSRDSFLRNSTMAQLIAWNPEYQKFSVHNINVETLMQICDLIWRTKDEEEVNKMHNSRQKAAYDWCIDINLGKKMYVEGKSWS